MITMQSVSLLYTVVSTKFVPQKGECVRDKATLLGLR